MSNLNDEAIAFYRDTPVEAVKHLKALWETRSDVPGAIWHELWQMASVLNMCFSGFPGHPSVEGDLWRACVDLDLPMVALEMLKDPGSYEQPFIWIPTAMGLNAAILLAWVQSGRLAQRPDLRPSGFDLEEHELTWKSLSDLQVKSFFHTIGSVWDMLWSRRAVLCSAMMRPLVGDVLLLFAVRFIAILCDLYPEYRHETTQSSSSVVGVVLAYWTIAIHSPGIPVKLYAMTFTVVMEYAGCVKQLLAAEDYSEDACLFWRSAIDMFLEEIGPVKFMRACLTELSSSPHMVGRNFQAVLETICYIASFRQELEGEFQMELAMTSPSRRAFYEAHMLSAISKALEREYSASMDAATAYTPNVTTCICSQACELLWLTLQGLVYLNEPPSMDGLSIYSVFSRCLLLLCYALKLDDPFNTPARVAEAIQSFNEKCSDWLAVREQWPENESQTIFMRRITQDLDAAAQASWYADMCVLRSQRDELGGNPQYDKLILSWTRLGESSGLEETVERDRRAAQSKRFCSWAACKYQKKPSPTPLSNCAGCGEQRYCSRECQKKDWKQGGHREKCRRLPAST